MDNPNTDKTQADSTETLVASFHRVGSLIPEDQELVKIPPEMRVADALKIMEQNRFSQLPVVAGDAVLGVFSYRSFSAKALAKQKSSREPLGELPVEDFLEEFEYAHANDDWNHVVRYLDQKEAFFVGHRNGLEGLVTTMDMLGYFREIANPFILIAEIELSLRKIIQACIESEALAGAITRSLKTAYPAGTVPKELNEMTFDNYVQIISNRENWPYFEKMFGEQPRARKQTTEKLQQLGQWRNTIFHFKRRLEPWELNVLTDHREWLHRRARAFQGRQDQLAAQQKRQTKVSATAPTKKSDGHRTLSQRQLLYQEFWTQLLDTARQKTALHAHISPPPETGVGVTAGKKDFKFYYRISKTAAMVAMEIYTPDVKQNERHLDKFLEHRDEIEAVFGEALEWNRHEGKRGCDIRYVLTNASLDDTERWPEIQERMIDAMIRLEEALRPHIERL